MQTSQDIGIIMLRRHTCIATVGSAQMLHDLTCQCAQKRISPKAYLSALREQIQLGHMLWSGPKDAEVFLTDQVNGSLLEFQAGDSDALLYAYQSRFYCKRVRNKTLVT